MSINKCKDGKSFPSRICLRIWLRSSQAHLNFFRRSIPFRFEARSITSQLLAAPSIWRWKIALICVIPTLYGRHVLRLTKPRSGKITLFIIKIARSAYIYIYIYINTPPSKSLASLGAQAACQSIDTHFGILTAHDNHKLGSLSHHKLIYVHELCLWCETQ